MLRAVVDTGSGYTLITEAAVKEKLKGIISQRHNVPILQGVTGTTLRVLGMTLLDIGVGDETSHKQWCPVVPNSYLDADILLGTDLISQASFKWNSKHNTVEWGGTTYLVNHIKRQRGKVERIRVMPPPLSNQQQLDQIRLRHSIKLDPYQAKFCPISVNENPGETLLVRPQPRLTPNHHPFIVTVDENKQVPLPFTNDAKSRTVIKPGTLLCTFEKLSSPTIKAINNQKQNPTSLEIHNDLLPHNDQTGGQKTKSRPQRLEELIGQQKWSHLSKEQRKTLKATILEHHDLFIVDKTELGLMKGPPAKINVSDPEPSRGPRYRYPEQAKTIIANMLTDMEERDIIEKSTSAWLSPIVLVNKPDGSKRMCLDYRHVNKHLTTDIYPLPRLEELVEQAAGHQYYATLDMKEAYFQILLEENSRDLTAFSDGVTLYRFKRLPFGLSCSPAIFTRHMASLLTPLVKKGWIKNYLDDLIVWAPDFSTLNERLSETFALLKKNGVKLNLSKCEMAKREVTFLGYKISSKGSQPDQKNVEAVLKMKPPTKVKEVRRLLGMAGFYRRHINNFAQIAAPLTNLTKKDHPFFWDDKCQEAFETLKSSLAQAPILARAQSHYPFILTTDASNTHVGGVLSQTQDDGSVKPLGYFSKKLNSTENRYSATDKEALAVVLSCRHFHHYLWGTSFTIFTDHQPLTSVFKRKTKSARMNRWILEMREYQYNIQYVKGKYNYVADQLSRPVRVVQRCPTPNYLGLTLDQMKTQQREENKWKEMIEYLEGGSIPTKKYHKSLLHQFNLIDELLYYTKENIDGSIHYSLVVPKSLIPKALEHAHVISGHLGQKKTIKKAEELFYWCNLKSDVTQYVKNCLTCQRFKVSPGLQQLYQELPSVNKPLDRLGIDLTDMIAGNGGYRYVLTIVDHFSRFVKFYPLKSKLSVGIVEALEQYMTDFGTPHTIVLDNGGEFTSQLFQQFCQRHLITLWYTTPYHPQGNAITERLHRTLKSILASMCQGYPLRWPRLLPMCQATMNAAVHTSIAQQPFFAFFSRHAPRVVGARLPTVDGDENDVEVVRRLIRETHEKMTRKYREVANRKRKDQKVDIGALVWVKRETTESGVCKKLCVRWDGPYQVVEVLREGGGYVVKDPFSGKMVQRAAEKVKPYHSEEEYVVEAQDTVFQPDLETEVLPPRIRNRPRRYVEEC